MNKNIKNVFSLILPSRVLMFKIMRACIGIETPDKLWINL